MGKILGIPMSLGDVHLISGIAHLASHGAFLDLLEATL